MRAVLNQMSGGESFYMLWIPTASTRDRMEAASVWTGLSASAYFRNIMPSAVADRMGYVRGMSVEGHGLSGQMHLMLRIAMSSTGAARMVSGSYGLLQGLAEGLEGLAKSLGAPPAPLPGTPRIEVSSEEHVVLVTMIKSP